LNKISRKEFLKQSSYITLGIISFSNMLFAAEKGLSIISNILPIQNDPNGILKVMEKFSYKIISEKGQIMSDGLTVPDKADGMASFIGEDGKIILIRNHEIGHFKTIEKLLKLNPFYKNKNYMNKNKNLIYDLGKNGVPCCGGTTTLVYNPKSKKIEKEYLSLAGTLVNCSGGPTPWNTWISCEETVATQNYDLAKNHGYNFEVTPSENINLNNAIPLKAMGRFRHEGVAIDPITSIAYQTEDRDEGLIYKFIPNTKEQYIMGGKLQSLSIKNGLNDTRNWNKNNYNKNIKYKIEWLDIQDVENKDDKLRYSMADKGAAIFARPEGIWFSNNIVYFTCTSGGAKKLGQIWKLDVKKQTIELMFESHNSDTMRKCDNITIAPWGDVIVCEDGKGKDKIIGIKENGDTYVIAENSFNNSEFAGVNFSPDGSILFVNIYSPTMTIAITGPWNLIT
tara:strand:+ start:100 stop:1455 length:1356 start_codon:yes stop_codon:yes gene_type:complete